MRELRHFGAQISGRLRSSLMILFALMVAGSVSAALTGTYTIDASKSASSTNYVSFKDAVEDLLNGTRSSGTANGPGVSGAVTFNVAKGTYEEQIEITAITGVSATNTVTFQSASGLKNTDVTMVDTSNTSGANYLISLSGATHVAFKNMTLSRNSSSSQTYSKVISVMDNSDSNSFIGNRIIGNMFASYYNDQTLVWSAYNASYSYTNDQGNLFQDNSLKYGSFSFYFAGQYSTNDEGNSFINNTLDSFYYGNIFYYQSNFKFNNNKVTNQRGTFSYGFYSYLGGNNYSVQNNLIDLSNGGGYGILVQQISSDSLNPTVIANNMITLKGASAYYGLYFYHYSSGGGNAYAEIVDNSIYYEPTSNNYANYIYASGSADSVFYHNNSTYNNASSAYLLYAPLTTSFIGFDNNNWYAPNNWSLYWGGTTYSSLSAMQTGISPFAANDIDANPRYVGNGDLHTSSIKLNAKGLVWKSAANVTKDYDGDVRSTTTPDIGADEWTPLAYDAELTSIDSPSAGFCAGTKDIYVTLTNTGLNTLTSASIDWSFAGTAQTGVSWTGTLTSGSSVAIKLGSKAFSGSSAFTIISEVTYANGSALTSSASTKKTRDVYVGLSGTYTVGGTSPDFSTPQLAADAVSLRSVCTSVTFNIRDGFYTGQLSVAAINGSSPTKTVTFQSESKDSSKVTLDYPAPSSFGGKDYSVQLDGADFVTFNQLTISRSFTSTTSNYGTAIRLVNGATNNMVKNCVIFTPANFSSYNYYVSASADTGNTLYNSSIKGGGYSVYIQGAYNQSAVGNKIIKNNIDSFYYMGIYTQYQKDEVIDQNLIQNALYPSGYAYGIYNYMGHGVAKMTRNYINLPNGGYGILTYYLGGRAYWSTTATGDTGLIANNQIYIGNYTSGSFGAAYGIYLGYSSAANVYHNTIENATNLSGTTYAAFLAYAPFSSGSFYNVQNNIFYSSGSALSIYISSSTGLNTIDNNDYYYLGSNLGYLGSTQSNLSAWQSATSQDANSVSVDPKLVASPTNMRAKASGINNKGKYVGVAIDYYGVARDKSVPDIGANEIASLNNNISAASIDSPSKGFCAGKKDIWVRLANNGKTTVTKAQVYYSVNSTVYGPFKYTFSGLLANKDTLLNVGSVTFTAGTIYSIRAWNDSIFNGTIVDQDRTDDTTRFYNLASSLNGTYTIGGATGRDYATVVDAVDALNNYGVCGKVVFNIDNGSYTGQLKFGKIAGASSVNTITFNGDSINVNINESVNTYGTGVVAFSGASWITLNGMTIQNTYSFGYHAVTVNGGSHHITVKSGQLRTGYKYGYTLFSQGDVDEDNTFKNLHIFDGFYNVYFAGTYTTSEKNNQFIGCTFDSGYYAGLLLYYQDSCTISKNMVDNINYPYGGGYGIYLYQIQNKFVVEKNIIHMPSAGYGMYINYLNGSSTDSAFFVNNMISIEGSGSYGSAGIYNAYGAIKNVNFYHNSVYNSYVNSSSNWGMYFASGGSDVYVINNNLSTDEGIPLEIGSTVTNDDYNNLYSVNSGNVGSVSGTAYTSISSWSSATGFSAKDISTDPYYVSATDLHAKASGLVAGTPVGVTTDIDGQKRSSTRPVMGADEFAPLKDDAAFASYVSPINGGCGDSNVVVSVNVSNVGSNSISSLPVRYRVYKGTTLFDSGSVNYTTSIASGGSALINFSTTKKINTYSGGVYTFNVYTDYGLDGDRKNDTGNKTIVYSAHFANPTTKSATTCGGSSKTTMYAKAAVKGRRNVWFDLTGNPVHQGDSFTVSVSKSTAYYVQTMADTAIAGEDFTTVNGSATSLTSITSLWGLGFDATKDVFIDSVEVIAASAGNVTVTVTDGTNTIVKTTSAVLGLGTPEKIGVKAFCPTATGYTITAASSVGLDYYYSGSGQNYPISKGGIDVTNAIAFGNATFYNNYYPFFFNWVVNDTDKCASGKVPVGVVIGSGGLPVAKMSIKNFCANDSIMVTDLSTITSGTITGGVINYGDGTYGKISTAGGSAYHKYPKAGVYTLTYAAAGSGGCVDDSTINITINDAPKADFTVSSAKCVGDSISFTNISSGTSATTWYFQGVKTATSGNPFKFAFSGAGPYTAALVLTSSKGCKDSLSKSVKVLSTPVLNAMMIDSSTLCGTSGIKFMADTTGGNGATYTWSFGDATATQNGQSVTHTYSKSGEYTATVTATNSGGCTNKNLVKKLVYAIPAPTKGFTTTLLTGKSYKFTATDVSKYYTYNWAFGDGKSDTGKSVSHVYTATGNVTISLTTTNVNKCSTTNDTASVVLVGIDANGNANAPFSMNAYPNPFESKTTIVYSISSREKVTVDVYDVLGRRVVRLVDGTLNAGQYSVAFDREVYNALPGIYLVKITSGTKVMTKEISSIK